MKLTDPIRKSRGIRATEEGLQKLQQAKASGRCDDGKPLTYVRVAEKAGISELTVKRFFGGNPVDRDSAIAIAQALGLEVSEVVAPDEWNPSEHTSEVIDWHEVCRTMLEVQKPKLRRQATEMGFELNVHIPLGLVERKQQSRRGSDFSLSAEQGTDFFQLGEEEIVQAYEQDEFLEQVIKQGQSKKSQGKRIAIIGEAGAGKTTLLEAIAFWNNLPGFPIWVSLASLGEKSLEEYLRQKWLKDALKTSDVTELEGELVKLFSSGKVWLLLDGVDEMPASSPVEALAKIREELTGWVADARVVLTCRVNIWDASVNALQGFDTYRTLEFSYGDGNHPDQVREFICQWFSNIDKPELREKLREKLDEDIHQRLRDLVKNPLRLSLLCQSWYFPQGDLPKTKVALYQRFTQAFYEWKQEVFTITLKEREDLNTALAQLALRAIDNEKSWFVIRESFALNVMGESLFQLAHHIGWLNLVYRDTETNEPLYAFFHTTFQEYFATLLIDDWHFFLNHVLDNPSLGTYRIFEPQWKEVILLWLGREDVAKEQKEAFIKALVEFNDRCNNFYWYRAFFLAVTGVTEFRDYSRADEIMAQLCYWSFGYLNDENHKGQMLFDPIKEKAIATLPKSEYSRAITTLIETLHTTKDEDIRQQAASSLGQIDPGNEMAIAALTNLLSTTQNENIRQQAASSLGQIDPGNEMAIAALTNLLSTTQNENIRQQAASSLGQIDTGNSEAIAVLLQLVQSANKGIRMKAAHSLGKIGTNNPTAIASLAELIENSQDKSIRSLAAYSLGKIGTDNPTAIATLVKLIENSQDESSRRLAFNLLNPTLAKPQIAVLVTALKDYLSDKTHENDFERYRDCYEVIWDCAQNLPYPDFYQAWHHLQITRYPEVTRTIDIYPTPNSQLLNLTELPKLLHSAINSDSELSDKVQLICIDGSKFIDPDNPATKIYNEMRRQGCPKSEDSKPKTMAQLQDYWDELNLESDKHLVLVFYERTPLAPLAKGGTGEKERFAKSFLNDLSKFDGNICVVTQPDIPLKSFSPSQSNLAEDIVMWIRRVVLES